MNFLSRITEKLLKVLRIHQMGRQGFDINRLLTHDENCAKNRIWYEGDSFEIGQFFGLIWNSAHSFWGATMTKGMEIRKIHIGLPKLLVDTLNNITISDFNGLEFANKADQDLWDEIEKENDFKKLLKKATEEVLKVGDGAFKISFDESISKLPIIEFYAAEDVEFIRRRGRIREIKFYTRYNVREVKYLLVETYGYGYVHYNLFQNETEVSLESLEATAGLQDVTFDKNIMLAVPYIIWQSDKYEGRGASIYDSKSDNFDAIDEVVSQWQDAVRSGRVKTYIPSCLIPRNFETGGLLLNNEFDNRFIAVGDDMSENAKNEIKVVQPDIKVEAYLQTYITQLDLCLQGVVSPSTLGIDVKKLDNAEAQREKEKVTLYTRQAILETLEKVLAALGGITLNAYNIQYGQAVEVYDLNANFGEYANPSFEAVIETMSNPNTPMSIEAKVEEIWGDSKTDEWKLQEVERIKQERGIIQMDEPSFTNDNLTEDFSENIEEI
jgi:hypothetical protein